MKKRLLVLLLALAMIFSTMPVIPVTAEDSIGAGTVNIINSTESETNEVNEGNTSGDENTQSVSSESTDTDFTDATGDESGEGEQAAAVAKIGDQSYATLAAAIAAANGATVTLIADVTLADTLAIPADITVTLDLNGYTISQTKEQTAGYQMILNDGNLTITDSVGGGKISYTDSGNGGEYISDTIYNRGTLVIKGGTIENLSSATVASNGYPHAVDNYSGIRDTSVTVNGGTIYCAEYSAIRMFCVSATYKADLVINGGTIKGAVDMQNGSKVAALGSLTVNGGTFETTKNANNIRFANWNGGATEYGITAAIKGGSFNGGFTKAYVPAAANWNDKIVSGGTFTNNEFANAVSAWVVAEDGFEARDGVVAYYVDTLADLQALAKKVQGGDKFSGKTVLLGADIDFVGTNWLEIGEDGTVVTDFRMLDFAGTFDGQNHTIKNFKYVVAQSGNHRAMMFSGTLTGIVKNLNVENVTATIAGGKTRVAAVANTITASSATEARLQNVHVKDFTIDCDNSTTDQTWFGALSVYTNGGNLAIKDCSVENFTLNANGVYMGSAVSSCITPNNDFVNVTVTNFTANVDTVNGVFGGFAGQTQSGGSNASFTNCHVSGLDMNIKTITGDNVGGFMSTIGAATQFYNCSTQGTIDVTEDTDTTKSVGGFIGDHGWNGMYGPDRQHEFKNCVADVDITAVSANVGGFVGNSTIASYPGRHIPAYFVGCEAKGDVKTTNGAAGGFVGMGDRGLFTDCSASGNVEGNIAGGFWGYVYPKTKAETMGSTHSDPNSKSIVIDSCSATGTVTGTEYEAGLIGFVKDVYVGADNTLGYATPILLSGNTPNDYNRHDYSSYEEVPSIKLCVAQVGDNKYESLADAIEAADNATITLLSDIELSAPITVPAGKTIVLDLNGKTVTYNSTTQGEAMITNKGNLTINDSSNPDTGVINYNYIGEADSTFSKGNYTISNGGTLTVNGGKITIANLKGHAKYPIDNNSTSGDAILVINGGHLYNYNTSAIRQFCNSTTNKNSVTISGGLIEGYCAIWVQNPGKNTVNGALSITGGEIRTTAKAYVDGTSALKDVSSRIYCTIDGEGGAWSTDSAVSITGGIINENVNLAEDAPAAITIGGSAKFNGFVKLPTILAVATVNGVEYSSLQEAVNAAQNGDTITLIGDVVLTKFVTISKSVTLDLNGHTISRDDGTGLYVNGADIVVTIKGEGTVTGTQAVYANDGLVKIEGGNFVGSVDDAPAVYVINNGNVEIYGGTFSNVNGKFVLNEYDATRNNTSITVYGGTFVGFNPADNAAEGAGTSFVPQGYKAVDNGDGTYGVVVNKIFKLHLTDPVTGEPASIPYIEGNDLATVIATGKLFYANYYTMTLEVLGDWVIDETIVIDYPMTINLNGHTITTTDDAYHAFRIASNVTIKNGTVDSSNSGYAFIVGYNTPVAGNLTIESGKYIGRTSVVSVTYGSVTVKGGEFSATAYNGGYDFLFNCVDRFYNAGAATVVIEGGSFYGWNPADNAAEGAGTSFVADGYLAEDLGNGVYGVRVDKDALAPIITITFTNSNTNTETTLKYPSERFDTIQKLIGTNSYADFVIGAEQSELLAYIADGTASNIVITLYDDIELDAPINFYNKYFQIPVEYAITLDGNGHTITWADGYNGTLINVESGVSLTMKNVTIDGENEFTFYNDTTTVENGVNWYNRFVNVGEEDKAVNDNVIVNAGNLTFDGVTIKNVTIASDSANGKTENTETGGYYLKYNDDLALIKSTGGSVKMNNTTITGNAGMVLNADNTATVLNGSAITYNMFCGRNGGGFDLVGGTMEINNTSICNNKGMARDATIIGVTTGAVVTMNSGKIDNNKHLGVGSNTAGAMIVVREGSEFIMNGGSISNNVGGRAGAIASRFATTEANIQLNAGTITDNTASNDSWNGADIFLRSPATIGDGMEVEGTIVVNAAPGELDITGGEFTDFELIVTDGLSAEITGGTFDRDPSEWLAEGFVPEDNGDGTYGVKEWYDANATELYINNIYDLLAFAKAVNGGNTFAGKTVKLMSAINLAGIEWAPIGGENVYFAGEFNGNGKTISNLTQTTGARMGLFGLIEKAYIHDLTLANVSFTVNENNARVGAIAGNLQYWNVIEDVTIDGITVVVNGNDGLIGSVTGYMWKSQMGNVDVKNAVYTVNGTGNVIGGHTAYGRAHVWDANVTGNNAHWLDGTVQTIDGVEYVLQNYFVDCDVDTITIDLNGTGSEVGGFFGSDTYNSHSNYFVRCTVTGLEVNVAAGTDQTVGGFIAWNNGTTSAGTAKGFENCSATGAINATGATGFYGGFVAQVGGRACDYNGASADVDIVCDGIAGGFVGATQQYFTHKITFTDCVANGDVTGKIAGGFAGETGLGGDGDNINVDFVGCEAYGAVTGTEIAGGFLGNVDMELPATNWSTVEGEGNLTLKDCVASKTVNGDGHVAGLVGYVNNVPTADFKEGAVLVPTFQANTYYVEPAFYPVEEDVVETILATLTFVYEGKTYTINYTGKDGQTLQDIIGTNDYADFTNASNWLVAYAAQAGQNPDWAVTDVVLTLYSDLDEGIILYNKYFQVPAYYSITIDLNGYTWTNTSGKKTIETYVDTTIKNGAVKNETTSGRAVDTRAALKLVLDNVTLTANKTGGQALTIGGDVGAGNRATVVANNTSISAMNGYGIIVYNPVDMTLTDSDVLAYGALYFKAASSSQGSAGSVVNVIDSELNTMNLHTADTNQFGTVVFEDDNVTLNVTGGQICAVAGIFAGTIEQYAILLKNDVTGIKVKTDANTVIYGNDISVLVMGDIAGNTIILPDDYMIEIDDSGYKTRDNGDGTVTVITYVEWVKEQLLAGNDVTLDRDILITDYDLVTALKLPSNGNGKYNEAHGNGAIFTIIKPGVVLDLNGHSIVWDAHHDDYCNKRQVSLFHVTATGVAGETSDFTVVDNSANKTGKVEVYGMGSGMYVTLTTAKATIAGGTWTNYPCKTCGASNIFMYPSHGATLEITGGTFEQENSEYLLGNMGSSQPTNGNSVGVDYDQTKVVISGGTFVNFDPSQVKFFDTSASGQETTTDGCAEGFVPVKNEDGTYGVKVWYDENATKLYINNIYDLLAFAKAVNSGITFKDQTVILTDDIDLSSIANWTPIGNDTNYFWGTFDGQGHTISNMTINVNTPDANQFVGLFGGVRKATLKNFKMTNVNIDVVGAKVRAAAVVAIAHSNSENHTTANINLENITVDGCVINAEAKSNSVAVGGLSGYCYPANMTNISVSNLTINPKASGSTFAGGLVGYMQGQNISNNGNTRAYYTVDGFNLNNVTIKSKSDDSLIGGFAGYTYYGYITLKNATIDGFNVEVDVTKEALVGGLIGLAHRSDKGHTFTNVEITDIDFDITSDSGVDVLVGGMVGYSGSPIAFSDSSVSGTITETTRNAASSAMAGGFVGGTVSWAQSYTDCAADVKVTGSNIVGGFTGYNGTTTTYANCSATQDPFIGSSNDSPITNNNSYVASVGNTYYAKLENAIADAENGDTVVLLDNLVLTESVILTVGENNEVTLDLNGKAVTVDGIANAPAFRVLGNLTVKNGTVDASDGINSYAFIVGNSTTAGTLTIESGEYIGITSAVSVTNGTAYIKGGTFSTEHDGEGTNYGTHYMLNLLDNAPANIVVTGGTFLGFDPANNTAEGANTSFIDTDNYHSIVNNSAYTVSAHNWINATYETPKHCDICGQTSGDVLGAVAEINGVKYESLQAAIEAAKDGDIIVVLADHELVWDGKANVDGLPVLVAVDGKVITIDLNGKKLTGTSGDADLTYYAAFAVDNDGSLTLKDSVGTGSVSITGTSTMYSLLMAYEYGANNATKLIVEGGSYYLETAHDSMIFCGQRASDLVYIKGGNFTLGNVGTGENGKPWIFNVVGQADGCANITGGTFNADINRQYWSKEAIVDKTCYVVNNGDGTWAVKEGAVAYVDTGMLSGGFFTPKDVGYATFEEALAAAIEAKDPNITLLKDVALKNYLVISETVAIDLNGYKINCGDFGFMLTSEAATLTVADEKLNVITTVVGGVVVYKDGAYSVKIPHYVAQIGENKYETLQEAIDAAKDGETIVLLDNLNIAEAAIQILGGKYNTLFRVTGKTVTIDMNDKVISGEYTGEAMLVGVFSAEENGHLTLTGNGTIDVTATTTVYGLIVCYEKTASITIENGTYTLDKAKDSLIYTGGNENVTINGGTFTLENIGTGPNGSPWIFNAGGQNTAHVIVTGGTFNADILHQYYPFEVMAPKEKALKNNGDGTYTMVDAVAYVNEQHKSGNWYTNEIGYATFEEAIAAALANVENATKAGTVSTITLLKDVTLSEALSIEGITLGINLNGFTFNGEIVLATEDAVLVAPEGLNVTTNVAGKKVVYADGKYTANTCDYVAQIGENKYESIEEAIAAAQSGDTIVILKDLTVSGITIGHTTSIELTIDLGGFTITGDGSNIAITSFRSGTVLTLKNGTITANTSGGTIKATYGGKLVLGNGLTVISGGQANAIVVDNGVVEVVEGATVTVKGGLNVINTTEKPNSVIITGGTFTGNLTITETTTCVITGGTFTVDVNAYCPTGYIAIDNGDGTWTVSEAAVAQINGVSYSTLAEAIAAAQSGDIIKLIADATESVVMLNKGVTLDLNGYTLTADYVVAFKGNFIIDGNDPAIKNGLLEVGNDNIVMDSENNPQMPVYVTVDGVRGYKFATMKWQWSEDIDLDGSDGSAYIKARPSFGGAINKVYLNESGNVKSSGISIVVRISWENSNGEILTQDYTFSNEMVAKGYAQGSHFKATVTNIANLKNVKITMMAVSDLGVYYISESKTINAVAQETTEETTKETVSE